jgi:O-antigen/teichoic acid export membrane protein
VRTVMGIKLFTMPLTILLAWFLPTLFGYNDQIILLIRIAIGVMLADTLSLSFYGILRGLHVLSYESLGMFVGQAITACIGAILVFTGHATLPLLVGALVCGSVWNMLFSTAQIMRRVGWKSFIPSWEKGLVPLGAALPFFLSGLFIKIYSYIEIHMLEVWKGSEAVGAYAAAYKLTYAFQFLPLAFVAALYPSMSANADRPDVLRRTLLKSFWYMALIGSPIVFGIWSLAPEIIVRFYTEDFLGAVLPLQVMIFALFFVFLDFPLGSLLNATHHQHAKMAIGGMTMIVSITANIFLIPAFGPLGAAIGGVIALAGICSFFYTRCRSGNGWIGDRRFWHGDRRSIDQTIFSYLDFHPYRRDRLRFGGHGIARYYAATST